MTDKSDYNKRIEQDLEDRHKHWLDRLHNHWVRQHLWAGQRFSRVRMFEFGRRRKWDEHDDRDTVQRWHPIGVDDALLDREDRKHGGGPFVRENTSTGQEFIEVVEIVPAATVGPIAVYRQWMVDPDGIEITDLSWVPKRSKLRMRLEHALRGVLNRCEYDEVVEQPKRSKPKLAVVNRR